MLIKKMLLAQELPEKGTPGAVFCREWGENGLAVHFYGKSGRPEVSWWSDGKNSIKYRREQGEWTARDLSGLMDGWYSREDGPEDGESREAAEKWAKANGAGRWFGRRLGQICKTFDDHHSYERRLRAEESREERMRREFAAFPKAPERRVETWLDEQLPQYLMYGKKSRRQERELRCTACGGTWRWTDRDIQRGRHESCPLCGREGICHPAFRKNPKSEKRAVWIVQREKATIWWRLTEYKRDITGDGTKVWCGWDILRVRETQKDGAGTPERRAYVCGNWGWKRCKGDRLWEHSGLIWPETLAEVFGERIGYAPVFLLGGIGREADLYHLTKALSTVEGAEYYAKLGLWRLLEDSFRDGRPIHVPPGMRNLARRFDITKAELEELIRYGEVPPDRFGAIRKLRGGEFRRSETERDMGLDAYIRHFTRWKEQNPRSYIGQIEQWYTDYIGMCREQGVDLDRKEVRFPRELRTEHDRLAERVRMARAENANREFAKACEGLYAPMHGYTDGKYTVVFPRLRTDLIAEGQSLHHCVGADAYYKTHMKGVRMIFFIRRADAPETPLYTMEADVKKGKIVQLYGAYDRSAPKEARAFCEAFLRQLWTGKPEKTRKCS